MSRALFKMLKIQFYTCLNHSKSVHRTLGLPSAQPFTKFPPRNSSCCCCTHTGCWVCKEFTPNSTGMESLSQKTKSCRGTGRSQLSPGSGDVPRAASQMLGSNGDSDVVSHPLRAKQSLKTTQIPIKILFFLINPF